MLMSWNVRVAFSIDTGFGGGTGETGGYGKDRLLDARKFAYFGAEKRCEPRDNDQGVDDNRHDRAAHEQRCQGSTAFVFLGDRHGLFSDQGAVAA